MKILALYTQHTLSLSRRVRAPFSVLAERAHSFSFLAVNSFIEGLTFGADVTVLQNWELNGDEVEELAKAVSHRAVVIDCSDPKLLDSDLYRRQLELASLVTVPNEYMHKEVHFINANTAITPSCIDLPFFTQANKIKLEHNGPMVIGCLGPYDWRLVKNALIEVAAKHTRLVVMTGPESSAILRETGIRGIEPDITIFTLPEIIRQCHFGLAPLDGESAIDRIWEHEYGSLCRPVLVSQSKSKETWIAKIEELISDTSKRNELGNLAFAAANNQRAVKRAGEYLSVYRKRLPHLLHH